MKPIMKSLASLAAVAALLTGGTGCSVPAAGGDLSRLQKIAEGCPSGAILASYVGTDVSGSSRTPEVVAARAAAIKDIATRVAVCGGNLRVDAFTASAAASRIIFDGPLDPAGATQIAKLRKVDDLVESTMTRIQAGTVEAAQALASGSDITSQFALAEEYAAQKSAAGKIKLTVDLMTDGIQTTGVVLNTAALTRASATSLARTAPVTTLPKGTVVTISGLGKTTGAPAPTSYVDALKTFYSIYCTRTGAASCVAVTDYTAGA